MTNMEAYQSDLDDILKALEALSEFVPTGKTKKDIERQERFAEATGKIRGTVSMMRNDYIPVEMR